MRKVSTALVLVLTISACGSETPAEPAEQFSVKQRDVSTLVDQSKYNLQMMGHLADGFTESSGVEHLEGARVCVYGSHLAPNLDKAVSDLGLNLTIKVYEGGERLVGMKFNFASSIRSCDALVAERGILEDFYRNPNMSDWDPEKNWVIFGSKSNSTINPKPKPTTTKASSGTVNESIGERNARGSAASYLKYSSFSRSGLIEQLEYEGFTTSQAEYGVDAQGANWNAQAALKAASYLNSSSFSRSGLIDQLKYEGFTTSQAQYGATAAGL